MAYEPLKADDLHLVNRLLQFQPELRETIDLIRQVIGKVKFPIQSFDDLSEALGGDDKTVTFRGRTLTVGEARNLIPAYYFPIGSERDLVAKITDLAKGRQGPPSTPPLEAGIKLMPAAAQRPERLESPNISADDVLRLSGFGKRAPGAGGLQG